MIKRKSLFVMIGLLAVVLCGIVVGTSLLPNVTSNVVVGEVLGASISGPYYVVAETTIMGPRVNLALVQEKTGGTLGADYVEFSSYYRIYMDNSFQYLSKQGSLSNVASTLENPGDEESNLQSQFNVLVSNGAIHPSSYLSSTMVMKGTPTNGWWTTWYYSSASGTTETVMFQTSELRAMQLKGTSGNYYWDCVLYLNGIEFIGLRNMVRGPHSSLRTDVPYSSGSFEFYTENSGVGHSAWVTLYTGDQPSVSIQPTYSIYVLDASGIGYSWKTLSPGSVKPEENLQVTTTYDTPEAVEANITEVFPADFDLVGDVLVEKYDQSGLIASAYVSVTPTVIFTRKQFNIDYIDVAWLSSLATDEWIKVTFTINSVVSGTYTFTPSRINYTPVPSS